MWAPTHGRIETFGIEGPGSYGAGLARAVRRAGHRVVEVNRGNRHTRRAVGKSDPVDAESAARSVSWRAKRPRPPKPGDGVVEMIRQLKIARNTAGKAPHRGDGHAEADRRECATPTCEKPSTPSPITVCSRAAPPSDRARSTRPPQPPSTPSGRLPIAGLPWLRKIATHDQHLTRLTTKAAPRLLEGFGVGAHTAAQMLISFGDNPDRIRSEAAFAKLCGACPIPASSGMTTGRHRLYRGGHRQANAALQRHGRRPHAASTSRRSTTSPAGRLAAGPDARSSAASNASSPVKSTSV